MSGTGSRAVLLAQCAPCDAALPGEAMARAGTTVRRCQRCAADAAPLVSGLRQRVGGGPGQVAVAGKGKRTRASGQGQADKTPEITAMEELLGEVLLTGWVVNIKPSLPARRTWSHWGE
jgi:hypothetical protein